MKRKSYTHASRLKDVCTYGGLEKIGEIPELVQSIMVEPIIFRDHWGGREQCPDLYIVNRNGLITVAELKHSYKHKSYAIEQIDAGMKALVDVFGMPLSNLTGKFVVYTENNFTYEVVR
jgi:hypothetical protein